MQSHEFFFLFKINYSNCILIKSGYVSISSTFMLDLSIISIITFSGEFACDQCGKVLKSKGSLDYHKRTHTGEFAYR